MKKQPSKLGLEKFRVARLNNAHWIMGGDEGAEGETQTNGDKQGSSIPCKLRTEKK